MKNNKYLDHCVFYKEDTLEKYIISFFFLRQMLMIEEKMLISSELSS